MHPETRKVTIYWRTTNRSIIKKIRDKFGIPNGMTVCGETDADINVADFPLLELTAEKGYIDIRYNQRKEYYPIFY
ncbi:MAG: hypothetical protein MJZ41_07700 [Bacteroidaceae bacterium]|nr:hypothetical protein [Bacteroidaceae bacterium]